MGSNGRAIYLFEADKNGTSACTGACAAAWPPVTVTGTPQAGSGVNQALLGTIKRSDGTTQVTYNGFSQGELKSRHEMILKLSPLAALRH